MSTTNSVLLLISLFFILGCKKDEKIDPAAPPVESKPVVIMNFNALVNNKALVPAIKGYTNTSKDNFTITRFNYYISNLKFKREDGSVFSEPESYHLIKHVEGKTTFTVTDLPEGNYTSIEFLIGVDANRNIQGAQTGDLDVNNEMFWDWDQGYIFFKLEGSYITLKQPIESQYGLHIGGFTGANSSIQFCRYDLSDPVIAKNGGTAKISFDAVVDEIFENPDTIGFEDFYAFPVEEGSKRLSDNYRDMLVLKKVENN
jgi:hypothetical protein